VKKFDTINVVPFIDIMLVLLAITLTTASFIATGKIKVNLPDAKSATNSTKTKEIFITIKKNGYYYLNDKRVDFKNIKNKLLKVKKSTLIVIKSDKNTKFKNFIKIIDLLKEIKHNNIAIAVVKS